MAVLPTLLADVIVPSLFQPYVIEKTAEKSELFRSGVIQKVDGLNSMLNGGGKIIDMPFWQDLQGADEIVTSGGTASVGKIETELDRARRLLRQKGWGAEDIAGILAGSDPMQAIASLVAEYWARRMQAMVLSTLKGIFSASSMSASVLDIAQTSGAATDVHKLNASTFVDAAQLLGDAKGKLAVIVMHSAVEASLLKNDLIDFIMDSQSARQISVFQGYRVVVDDGMPVETVDSKPVYTSYLFGQGAIGYGENMAPKPVAGGIGDWYQELSRVPGQGLSIMYNRRDFILHPRGVKFTDAAVAAETPTNAELETGTNWLRVYERKNVRIVKIRHNV